MTKCKHCQVYTPDDYGCCPQCGAPLVPFNACRIGEHGCQRIVINADYGGFHPSAKAIMRWAELSGIEMHCIVGIDRNFSLTEPRHYREIDLAKEPESFLNTYFITKPLMEDGTIDDSSYWYWGSNDEFEKKFRTDPNLIQAIEELGDEASGSCSTLKIVEIPDEVEWVIQEYDGMEWIAEKHRTWE
jgi:hypothetical protein